MFYLDSCDRRLYSLVAHDPGVGSWEVIHSKSGGRKNTKIESLSFLLFLLYIATPSLTVLFLFLHTGCDLIAFLLLLFHFNSSRIGQFHGQISKLVLCRQKRKKQGKARGFSLNLCHVGLRLHLLARLSCAHLAGGPVRKNCADVRKERVSGNGGRTSPLCCYNMAEID